MRGTYAGRLLSRVLVAIGLLPVAGRLMVASARDQPPDFGPDVVILRELENEYESVPFDHLSHAKMAEMWHGCVTCHHYSPQPHDVATTTIPTDAMTQQHSVEVPACKSCHPVSGIETDIHMPGLKGAYHRQCLSCHKEWMHENACVICHEPKQSTRPPEFEPSPGDIVGRMHPPIPEPDDVTYDTRFTPADGGNVLFRHKGHTIDFGIRCVDCHHQDNCAHCHGPTGDTSAQKPLHPGMTWDESHGPCMGCHSQDRCRHCHYKDDQTPPPPFRHAMTGQQLDEEHAVLACNECHMDLACDTEPTCGSTACHENKDIEYPAELPGPLATPAPEPAPVESEAGEDNVP